MRTTRNQPLKSFYFNLGVDLGSGSEYYDYGNEDYNYEDYSGDECDKPCDFYDDENCAKKCHHRQVNFVQGGRKNGVQPDQFASF